MRLVFILGPLIFSILAKSQGANINFQLNEKETESTLEANEPPVYTPEPNDGPGAEPNDGLEAVEEEEEEEEEDEGEGEEGEEEEEEEEGEEGEETKYS